MENEKPSERLAREVGVEDPDVARKLIEHAAEKEAAEPTPLSDAEEATLARVIDVPEELPVGEHVAPPPVVAQEAPSPGVAPMTKGCVVVISPGYGGSVADLSRPPSRQ